MCMIRSQNTKMKSLSMMGDHTKTVYLHNLEVPAERYRHKGPEREVRFGRRSKPGFPLSSEKLSSCTQDLMVLKRLEYFYLVMPSNL